MAQASRLERKIRRIKNDRRLAAKMAEVALAQRDQARFIAGALDQRIQALEKQLKDKDSVTIKVLEDESEQPESVILPETVQS